MNTINYLNLKSKENFWRLEEKQRENQEVEKKKKVFHRSFKFLLENKVNFIGLILGLIGALAFFNFGLIGNLFANLIRIPFGNAYRLIWVLLAIVGGFLFVERPLPKIKDHFIWGVLVGLVVIFCLHQL